MELWPSRLLSRQGFFVSELVLLIKVCLRLDILWVSDEVSVFLQADLSQGLCCLFSFPHHWLRKAEAGTWIADACQEVFIAILSCGITGDHPLYQGTVVGQILCKAVLVDLKPCNY